MQKATQQQTKEHNSRLVLKTIYRQGNISRAEIARLTNLTRTTVSDIVTELMQAGLLEEIGVGSSGGGKPPILLNVKDGSRQLICLDLSNGDFQGALVNLRGNLLYRVSQPLNCQFGDAALDSVFTLVDKLLSKAYAPILGIGIGSPGLVDTSHGIVRRAVNVGWTDLPLKSLLSERYGLPIYLANDAHAAALAEYTYGRARQVNNLVVIKIGYGIGSGIVLSGQLHFGDGFGAGEIGHLAVVENGEQCTCGNYGCLETVASIRAILNKAKGAAWQNSPYLSQPDNEITLMDLLEAIRSGNDTVTSSIREAGRLLGTIIANMIGILSVHNIILCGSITQFGDVFLEAVKAEAENKILSTIAPEVNIYYSSLGTDIVLLGASALVLSHEYGLP